jgi:hypothetical protein
VAMGLLLVTGVVDIEGDRTPAIGACHDRI